MTQRRIWNFGDTFTSDRAITASAALHEPGVYSGYDIVIIDTDAIQFSPGWALLPNGILVGESNPVELVISPLSSTAIDYTLVVRHVDADVMGGQAATYSLEVGLLTQDSILNGVPLAWIRYPGGAVPLSDYFIFPARKISGQSENSPHLVPTVFLPPFTGNWVISVTGPNTTVTEVWASPRVYTKVETDGLGPTPPGFETTTAVIPVVAGRFRPVNLVVRSVVDANSQLLISMRDTDGSIVSLTDAVLSSSSTFSPRTVSVDPSSGVFTEGDIYTVELTFRTPSLDSVDLQSLTINYDSLP